MVKKITILTIICCLFPIISQSMSLSGLIGFGHYWVESSSATGFTLTGYFDPAGSPNFGLTPTLNIWLGSEEGTSIFDLCPGVGLKIKIPAGAMISFFGLKPELHIFFAEGETLTRFGFRGLGGVEILFAEHLGMPVQISYGKFFYEDGSTNVFTAKIGLMMKF